MARGRARGPRRGRKTDRKRPSVHCDSDCEFVLPPPKSLQSECTVCLLILREPYQAKCCGNIFCEACVKRLEADAKRCPTCNALNFNVFPDKRLKRSLNEFSVYCSHKEEGCKWVGELGELDKHLNLQPPPDKLLVGCQFSKIGCSYCSESFQRRSLGGHQSDECLKRPYSCQHCGQSSTFDDVTGKHWPVCRSFPLSCPNNCGATVQRQEVEQHVSQDCPLTVIECDFKAVGCEVRLARRDMPSHISANLTGHMTCMQQIIATANKEVQDLQARITAQEKSISSTNKIMQDLLGRVASQERTIQSLQSRVRRPTVCLPPTTFTLSYFQWHKQANMVWHSPPFYSHPRGYRMCLEVYPNGHGKGASTHVSIYLCIMSGPFDNWLKWPFKGEVSIQLLNQLEDSKHKRITIPYTGNEKADRVTGREISSIGWGFSEVLPHSSLALNTTRSTEFLLRDMLRIEVLTVMCK